MPRPVLSPRALRPHTPRPRTLPLRALRPLVLRPLVLAALALLALSVAGCSPSRPHMSFEGALLPRGLHARAFALEDEQGRRVSPSDASRRVRLLAFLPLSTRAARLVAQQIRGALDDLGGDATRVTTLIVSTELHATRAQRVRFLREAFLQARARCLSGSPGELRSVWKAYAVLPASAGESAFLASTPVLLVDRSGVERVGFAVEQLTPESLAHDLRALLEQ